MSALITEDVLQRWFERSLPAAKEKLSHSHQLILLADELKQIIKKEVTEK